jgi:hypothetical protein
VLYGKYLFKKLKNKKIQLVFFLKKNSTSIGYLAIERYRNHNKYNSTTEIQSIVVSIKKRKITIVLLTGILFAGWLYETLKYVLSGHYELHDILNLITYSISWVIL